MPTFRTGLTRSVTLEIRIFYLVETGDTEPEAKRGLMAHFNCVPASSLLSSSLRFGLHS